MGVVSGNPSEPEIAEKIENFLQDIAHTLEDLYVVAPRAHACAKG